MVVYTVCFEPDREGYLVVLHFQAVGVARHRYLYSSQEEQSDIIPTRLSSCLHVRAVVDWRQVGRRRNVYVQFTHINRIRLPLCLTESRLCTTLTPL